MVIGLAASVYGAALDYSVSQATISTSSDYKASFSITVPAPAEAYGGIQFAVDLPSGASIDSVKYNTNKGAVIPPQAASSGTWYFGLFSDTNVFSDQLVCTVDLIYNAQSAGTIVINEIKLEILHGFAQIETIKSDKKYITINPYTAGTGNGYSIVAAASPENGGTVTGGGVYMGGDNVTLLAAPSSQYRFVGWYDNNNQVSTANPYVFKATSNLTLVARFEPAGSAPGGPGGNGGGVSGGGSGATGGGGGGDGVGTAPPDETIDQSGIPAAGIQGAGSTKPLPKLDKTSGKSYISGYPDGTFKPEAYITRAETVAMFYAIVDDPNKNNFTSKAAVFSDVGVDKWYSEAVGYLTEAGIVAGYPDGTFRGDAEITRAEFAKIVSGFEGLTPTGDMPFPDVGESHWAYKYILSCYNRKWITGYPDGTFQPDRLIIRAEAVTIMNRAIGRNLSDYLGLGTRFPDVNPDAWYYPEIVAASNNKE